MSNEENPVVDRVVIYTDKESKWRWTAKAGNFKNVGDSGQGYKTKQHAIKMAKEMYPDAEIIIDDRRVFYQGKEVKEGENNG